jgi:hypothetical protein
MLHFPGNLMNFHADILGQRILKPMPQLDHIPQANQEHREHVQDNVNDCTNVNQVNAVKQEAHKISVINREDDVSKLKESNPLVKKNPSVDHLDEIILEADSVLENSAWSIAMDKYLDKDLDIDLDLLLEDALLENTAKDEKENLIEKKEIHREEIYEENQMKKPLFAKENDFVDNFEDHVLPRSSGFVSVIRGPELVFSREELNMLTRSKIIHTDISRRAMPISLHQAWVAHYLGKLSMEGMMSIIAAGRKAQNFYHFMTMASQPYFNELTTR